MNINNEVPKVLDWWRDFDTNEYFAIIEKDGVWKLLSRKVQD
jgi:hypothetical protein